MTFAAEGAARRAEERRGAVRARSAWVGLRGVGSRRLLALFGGATLFASACGSGDAPPPRSVPRAATTLPTARPADDGIEIEGTLGTIRQQDIDRGIEPRMPRFLRCFAARSADVDVLAGRITLAFRVKRDGAVRWAHAKESTLGDREAERCILDIARETHFPRPRGGEAEFSLPLEFDAPSDVRPPTVWNEHDVEAVVAESRTSLTDHCARVPTTRVTAYIAPGGRVLSAGAAVEPSLEVEDDAIDCVIEAVRAWTFPDPGSYPAKVTFEVRR